MVLEIESRGALSGLGEKYVAGAESNLRRAAEQLRSAIHLMPAVADKPKDKVQVEFGEREKPFWKP